MLNKGGFSAGTQAAQQVVGTTVKFVPTTSQDAISRNGQQTTINTNHQCITAMKEYESKSLEELRFEDYQANRKFPQAQSQFGGTSTIFSSGTTASSGFGSSNLFNSTAQANRPLLFGSNTGTTTTAATTQPQTTSLFGSTTQPNTANRSFFGSTTATTTPSTTTGFSSFGSQPATQVFIYLFIFLLYSIKVVIFI